MSQALWLVTAALLLAGGCYPDRIPERRVRVDGGDGDGGMGGSMGGAGTGGGSSGGASSGGSGTGGDGTGGGAQNDCVLRVDVSVTSALPDGATWATAFAHPEAALSFITSEGLGECDLWIAEGSYSVSAPGLSVSGARLLGGFDGSEVTFAERNPEAHEVTLEADGAGVTLLTMTGGGADALGIAGGELGVLVESGEVTLQGVDVFGNGPTGGIVVDTAATLSLSESRLFQNESTDSSGGGALLARSSSEVTVEDCIFANNQTSGSSGVRRGGAAHLFGLKSEVRRSIFVGNASATDGGALTLGGAGWRVEDSVFIGNSATNGAAIDADAEGEAVNVTASLNLGGTAFEGAATIVNSIFWNNAEELPSAGDQPDVYSTVVEGGYSGGVNDNVFVFDPDFEGTLLTNTSTTISSGARTSVLGHGASGVPQGSFVGNFLHVQDGAGEGYYYLVDNSASALELLGEWGSDLNTSGIAVVELALARDGTGDAIDRGRGAGIVPNSGVSGQDVLGNDRQDLPAIINLGLGMPDFVDLGAYERQP